jgi:hypothetical protein
MTRPEVRPLKHTGDSANIAFYAPEDKTGGYVWCEVLRNDWARVDGKMVLRPLPQFHITVRQFNVGEIARFSYTPPRRGRFALGDWTVTRLVREHFLKEA